MDDKERIEKRESIAQWVHGRLISGRPTFTLEEAMSATSLRHPALALALHRLKARKLIVSPMRGFYVCVPDRYQLRGEVPPSLCQIVISFAAKCRPVFMWTTLCDNLDVAII